MKRDLRLQATYPHPPAKVWRVLTSSQHLAAWLMPNDFEPKLGHKFQFRSKPMGGWDGIVNCEILELVPEKKLVFTWTSNMLDTKVTFLLEPIAEGTQFTLLHTGFKGAKPYWISYLLGSGWKGHVHKYIPALIDKLDKEGRL